MSDDFDADNADCKQPVPVGGPQEASAKTTLRAAVTEIADAAATPGTKVPQLRLPGGVVVGVVCLLLIGLLSAIGVWSLWDRGHSRATAPNDFDAEKAVADYRKAIQLRDAQTTPEGRAQFEGVIYRMRRVWEASQGKDSLHETAFGEPDEE